LHAPSSLPTGVYSSLLARGPMESHASSEREGRSTEGLTPYRPGGRVAP